MNVLYERIRERRLKLGMTQETLALEAGYTSRSTIAKIEAGRIDIPQSKIEMLASALKTTPEYLLGWSDESEDYASDLYADVAVPDEFFPDITDPEERIKAMLAFNKSVEDGYNQEREQCLLLINEITKVLLELSEEKLTQIKDFVDFVKTK